MRKITPVLLLLLTGIFRVGGKDARSLKFTFNSWKTEVVFSNTTGTTLECSASGNPRPVIEWLINPKNDGPRQYYDESLRTSKTVVEKPFRIFPFSSEEFLPSLHANSYRCRVQNSAGVIISPSIKIRAVLDQDYDLQVFPTYSYLGNTAVIKCLVPPFLKEFIRIDSWIWGSDVLRPGDRLSVFPSRGELHVRNVSLRDGAKSYRCSGIHVLTGKKIVSSVSGRLSIQSPKSLIPVRIERNSMPEKIIVKVGDSVEIPCVALGLPPPKYAWFRKYSKPKDKSMTLVPVTEYFKKGGSLFLNDAEPSQAGTWTCKAENELGYETVDITLIVRKPLELSIKPLRQKADVGSRAEFECRFEGSPILSVNWLKDGSKLPIIPKGREIITDENSSLLRIGSVGREDKGMYQCFLEGEEEVLGESSQLDLGDSKPVLMRVFEHRILQPGQSLSLTCEAGGSPLPAITWMINGISPDSDVQIFNETLSEDQAASTLRISEIRGIQGGNFACEARNPLGAAFHGRRVDIYGPPYVQPMKTVSAVAGSEIWVHCPYSGYPIVEARWSKNGETLPVNERQRIFSKNASLQIINVHSVDKGEYTCSVSNGRGDRAHESFELSVLIPPKIENFAFKEDLQVGGRVRVTCTASLGDLPIKFQWFFDDHALIEGNHSNGVFVSTVDVFSSSLVIPKLAKSHSGNFTCLASNSAASDSFSAVLTVNVPLSWKATPSDANAMLGQSIMVHCLVEGFPLPTIRWNKEDSDRPGSFRAIQETQSKFQLFPNGSLYIRSVEGDDDGKYLCRATNGVSEQGLSKLARISVNVPARFSEPVMNQTVSLGSRAVVSCPVIGNNPIRVTWKRNHRPLVTDRFKVKEEIGVRGMTSKVILRSVQRGDSSYFQCFASNRFGKAQRTVKLIVQEPPEVPKSARIVTCSSRNTNVTWSKPYDGKSQISSYIIQYKKLKETWDEASNHIVGGRSRWAEIHGLAPANTYELRLKAENDVGASEPTRTLTIRTKEEIPEGPPTSVRAASNGSQSIIVTWKAPLLELRHGSILGYYLGYKITNSSEPYRYQTLEMKRRHERKGSSRNKETLELVLLHLKKYTGYSLVVQAYNSVGAGPKSKELRVRTDEDVPSSPPRNVGCTPLSSTSLLILWSPPPISEANGILKDYRVFYRPLKEWDENAVIRDKTTSRHKITLYELDQYQNYTIQVVASTRVGEGLKSRSIYCRTKEGAPGPPANIKAISADQHSIFVSWLPPSSPNGKIIHHNVYMKTMESGRQFTQNFEVYPPSLTYVIRGLNQNQPYSFWVASSTIVGRGEDSEIVAETPSLPIPASIASFSRKLFAAVNEEIEFPCLSLGKPKPTTLWTYNEKILEQDSRIFIDVEMGNVLRISRLELADTGNYTCSVKNHFGSDTIQYFLEVKVSRNNGVPPAPPTLSVIQTTSESITLGWTPSVDGGSPLLGYRIHHHREFGDWDRIDINPLNNSYNFINLRCGTHYQFYIQAVNDFGVGERTETVSARTRGTSPIAPTNEDFIKVNSTSIVLRLEAWKTGGCPISSFVVEYQKSGRGIDISSWVLVNNNVKMTEDKTFSVLDLNPQTSYSLRVTAHNSAGSTVEEYRFITLTFAGAAIAPELIIHSGYGGMGFLLSPGFLLSFFSVIILAGIIAFFVRKKWPLSKRHSEHSSHSERRDSFSSNEDHGNPHRDLSGKPSDSDKQIILPPVINPEDSSSPTTTMPGRYFMEGCCPPPSLTGQTFGTLSRKKTPNYGQPIILQQHHHHVHNRTSNFYSPDTTSGAKQDQCISPVQFYNDCYRVPDTANVENTNPSNEYSLKINNENNAEIFVGGNERTGENWIPLKHLYGAQRL